jgi:chorismate--pyruvate lyase
LSSPPPSPARISRADTAAAIAPGSSHEWSSHEWKWRPWLPPRALPAGLLPWLRDEGSLTRQLTRLLGRPIRVERLSQRWQLPQRSEARLLGLPPGQRALVREVILWGGDEPWVYARSILPVSALRGDLARLRRLRNAPLGALLFRYPELTRTPFELTAFAPEQPPRLRELAGGATLYGRRSRFALGRRRLIVAELFLPGFRPHQPPQRRPR